MDIERLHSRLQTIICDCLNYQDLFQTHPGVINAQVSAKNLRKIGDVGQLRYRNDALFNQRVDQLSAQIIDEIRSTIKVEGK